MGPVLSTGTYGDENNNFHNTSTIMRMRYTIYRCVLKTNLVKIPVLMDHVMILVTMEFVLTKIIIHFKNFVQFVVNNTFSHLFSGS